MSGIEAFSRHFLAKLADLPAKYDAEYNAQVPRGARDGRRPALGVAEVTLRALHEEPAVVCTAKLSRSERTLVRLVRDAARAMSCAEQDVVLVRDGRVLPPAKEGLAAHVADGASVPVYIFNRRRWGAAAETAQAAAPLGAEFERELAGLLEKHGLRDAQLVARKFTSAYPSWLVDE